MADGKITLKFDVDGALRSAAQVRAVERSLDRLDRRAAGLTSRMNALSQSLMSPGGTVTTITKLKRSFDDFDKIIKTVGTIGLKAFSGAMKFATLEMGAMAAGMLAVHASFILGNAAMKAMRATLGPLAAGMTTFVAGATAAAAAIREQQAAMYAYTTTTNKEFGSSLNQTRQVMRGLHTDSSLASVGVENLNKAFGTISKNSTFTGRSQVLLKSLMDFASAGQPIEEGIQKAADLIAMLQDSKKSFAEAKTSAQQLFPNQQAMDKALKDLKITTKKGLEKALTSGELAKAAGVEGQFEAVSGTLINRMKGYFNVIRNQFADLGQPLLEPIKTAMYEIFKILQRGFVKISGDTQKFGMTSMLDGLISMVDKLTTWSTNLINNNIKSVDGMFERMASWWKEFKYGWNETLDKLRPFIDGARVIEKMFGATWGHIKNIVSSSFGQFNEWLQRNETTVVEFGDRIGKLISSIMKFQMEMKKLLQDLLPFINDVIDGISMMVDQLTGFLTTMRKLTGGGAIGALATILGVRTAFGAMKGTKGGFVPDMKKATINAPNATIVTNATPGSWRPGGGAGGMTGGGALGTTGAYYAGGGAGAGLASRSGGMMTTLPPPVPGSVPIPGAPLPPPVPGSVPIPGAPPVPIAPTAGAGMPSRYRRFMGRMSRFEQRYFMNEGLTPEERAYNRAFEGTGTYDVNTRQEIMRNKEGMRAAMARRAIANRMGRTQSSFGRGYSRFQGSSGAKMGTSMLLGAASQFAPEEAQGALALGSAVGMFNPLAGVAVAGLGTAMKSKTTAGGAMSGLAGGAAAGAMVGMFVPVIGPFVGAVVGGLIGAVTGGIMGSINKKREEVKKSKAAASSAAASTINIALSQTLDAVRGKETGVGRSATRDAMTQANIYQRKTIKLIENANFGVPEPASVKLERQRELVKKIYGNQSQYGMSISKTQYEDMLKRPAEAIKQLMKDQKINLEASEPLQKNYNERLDALNKITGKSDQEIIALAKSMNVNLYDSTKDFNEVLKELGLTITKTAEQMNAATTDIVVNNLSVFDKEIAKLKTPRIVNEIAKSLRQTYDAQGRKLTKEQTVEFMKSVQEQNIAMYGQGGTALAQFMKTFGPGGTAFSGGPLKGMKGVNFANDPTYRAYVAKTQTDLGQLYGAQLNSVLGRSGKSIDVGQFTSIVRKMTPEQLKNLEDAANRGFDLSSSAGLRMVEQYGTEGAILRMAGAEGLTLTDISQKQVKLEELPQEMANKTTELINQMKIFYEETDKQVPEWYTKESFEKLLGNDTTTPRGHIVGDTTSSRLSQTMARHESMNSMLTGKRTVTSSYRTFGLGSINSDHVTGRAYDLVGQNLGQYQSLVRSSGGFAEFHGVNGARHLHVVPGSGAVGDNMVPVAKKLQQPVVMGSGANGNEYNFYITGNQNASAKEIAEMVMQKVKETERSTKERM